MNKTEFDILNAVLNNPDSNQREIANETGSSLGLVNKTIKKLTDYNYIDQEHKMTDKTEKLVNNRAPRNAIILAAGYGMRMVPINMTQPKGLLKIGGETLIERLISQLNEMGITDISIVVGFMKEQFEYLIDRYGVNLIYNKDYGTRNNLISLALAADRINNTYIMPSDLWCRNNPFSSREMYSWYMVSSASDHESEVRINRKIELVKTIPGEAGNRMIGIAYITDDISESVKALLKTYSIDHLHDNDFWESVLFNNKKMTVFPKIVYPSDVHEINTVEELRELDSGSDHLKTGPLKVIADVLDTSTDNIREISVLKKGMTNRSFLFSVNGKKYIMRIPGEGTDKLINRCEEAEVYSTIKGIGLCDDPVYINPENGYKITSYLNDIRVCDPENDSDLKRCMELLKRFHSMNLTVRHTFDLFKQIELYESLWDGQPSIYQDYTETKAKVLDLKKYIDGMEKDWCLTHIDAVPDNFLFYKKEGTEEELLQLTDWEYAGMQDPHVDIAMFCIYSLYDKKQVDHLIDIYFENCCEPKIRRKIYAYISICGLLWSNWCEFKRNLGVEFGEYSLRQYRFAKEYWKYAIEE